MLPRYIFKETHNNIVQQDMKEYFTRINKIILHFSSLKILSILVGAELRSSISKSYDPNMFKQTISNVNQIKH